MPHNLYNTTTVAQVSAGICQCVVANVFFCAEDRFGTCSGNEKCLTPVIEVSSQQRTFQLSVWKLWHTYVVAQADAI
jgi:hypothetical protein